MHSQLDQFHLKPCEVDPLPAIVHDIKLLIPKLCIIFILHSVHLQQQFRRAHIQLHTYILWLGSVFAPDLLRFQFSDFRRRLPQSPFDPFSREEGELQKITFPSTRKVFRLESGGSSQQGQNRKRMCSVLRCGHVAGGLLCCLLVRISKSFIIILWHRMWPEAPGPLFPPLFGIGHLNR